MVIELLVVWVHSGFSGGVNGNGGGSGMAARGFGVGTMAVLLVAVVVGKQQW